MKDLYTFDASADAALKTYEEVRQAYTNIFDELKLPYLVADADSGNMGGKLSHEYHFVSPKGEDNVWSCNSCSYVANEELVEKGSNEKASTLQGKDLTFTGISTDHKTIINISIHRPHSISESEEISWDRINDFINLHAVKRLLPPNCTLDTGIEASTLSSLLTSLSSTLKTIHITASNTTTNLTTILPNDPCPHCPSGTLSVQRAIEVAHTFHLGTRYSEPLNALIAMPDTANSNNTTKQAMQMGCHGIGVSRLIGVIASLLSDTKGLNWPRVIAPYEVAVIPGGQVSKEEGEGIYDLLSGLEERGGRGRLREGDVDVVLDDREGRSLGWKLKDADLIGYPVIVVLGRDWKEGRKVEVQCRRLGVKSVVEVAEVKGVVEGLLDQL